MLLPSTCRVGLIQSIAPQAGAVLPPPQAPPSSYQDLLERLADVERDYIQAALRATKHKIQRTARFLGVSRQQRYRTMKRLGVREEEGATEGTE